MYQSLQSIRYTNKLRYLFTSRMNIHCEIEMINILVNKRRLLFLITINEFGVTEYIPLYAIKYIHRYYKADYRSF